MNTAIRFGASLVIAAASASAVADEDARAQHTRGVEQQPVMMERYPDADIAANHRPDGEAASHDASRADERRGDVIFVRGANTASRDEPASSDDRWLREREGYRDGGY